jgi:hypothetical protein
LAEPVEEESHANKMTRFRELTARYNHVEAAVAQAVENEEYEIAAELDDEMQQLVLDLGNLDLTEEQMDAALVEPLEETAPSSSEVEPPQDTDAQAEEHESSPQDTDAQSEEHESSDPPLDADANDAEETPDDSANDAEETPDDSPEDNEKDEPAESNETEHVEQPLENGSEDKDDVSNGDALSDDGQVDTEEYTNGATAEDTRSSSEPDYVEMLTSFYQTHNPSKVGDVARTLEKYLGREAQLFSALSQKYEVEDPLAYKPPALAVASSDDDADIEY